MNVLRAVLTCDCMPETFDDKWFKAAKRKAGVTNSEIGARRGRDHSVISKIANGSQPMTLEWAQTFSEILDVPLATVLEKTGAAQPPLARALPPGLSEGDAAPFTYAPSMPEVARHREIARTMGERPGVDVWRVKGRAMMLAGLIEGDFILVDTHAAERVRPGDIVIAQVYNPRGAITVLRRFEPPVLVAASPDPADARVHVVDGENVVIRGKVIASWRV